MATQNNKGNVITSQPSLRGTKQFASLTPKLRFKEFEGEWEETTLGELFTFKNGLNSDKEKYGSGIKFINVLDIISEDVITYDSIIGMVEVTDKELEKNEVIYGDVLFQRSSETRDEVGQANVYVDKNESAVFGGFVIRGRKKVEYNPYFINYLLKTSSARKEITTKSGGSTRYNVGQESLSQVFVKLTDLKEQQKIADFLTAVDTKLQQLTTKKETLALYKKGVMQQLFSQQLRFKDDDGSDFADWEEKRLGEVCNITTGKLDANAMVENGEFRFYTCAKDYYQIDSYEFDTDALIVSGNGANVGYVHHFNGKFNAYQRTYVLDGFEQNIFYMRHFLDKFLHKRIFREKKDGNTPYIVMSTLSEMEILIPSLKEQQKIANYLSAIDLKIEAVQTQISNTQAFKKGLLQAMFV